VGSESTGEEGGGRACSLDELENQARKTVPQTPPKPSLGWYLHNGLEKKVKKKKGGKNGKVSLDHGDGQTEKGGIMKTPNRRRRVRGSYPRSFGHHRLRRESAIDEVGRARSPLGHQKKVEAVMEGMRRQGRKELGVHLTGEKQGVRGGRREMGSGKNMQQLLSSTGGGGGLEKGKRSWITTTSKESPNAAAGYELLGKKRTKRVESWWTARDS